MILKGLVEKYSNSKYPLIAIPQKIYTILLNGIAVFSGNYEDMVLQRQEIEKTLYVIDKKQNYTIGHRMTGIWEYESKFTYLSIIANKL